MSAPGPCRFATDQIHPVCEFQQIQLWWQAPITGGTFDSFVISLAGTPVLTINDPTAYTTVMTGLTNGTEYQYSIQAQNSVTSTLGPSVSWRSVQPGNSTAAPTLVSFVQSGTTVSVSWTAPAFNADAATIKWYVFTLIPSSGSSVRYPLHPYDRSIVIGGLTSSLAYFGELVAINDPGYSPPLPIQLIALLASQSQGLAWSLNGLNWTLSPSSLTASGNTQFTCAAWNGSLWVAGGETQGNYLIYSSNGINWTASVNGNSVVTSVYTISWNGTRWIAGGLGMAYSTDGRNWTAVTANSLATCYGVYSSRSANLTVACGGTNIRPIYSIDGIIWTSSANGNYFGTQAFRVAYNGSRWVIGSGGGDGPRLMYSSDARTWTASANGNTIFTQSIGGVATNGSIWVAGTITNTTTLNVLGWSDDGITWNASTNGNSLFTRIFGLSWTGTIFLAAGQGVGANTGAAYSTDGKTWIASTTNPLTGLVSGVGSTFPSF